MPRPRPTRRFPSEVLNAAEVRSLLGACGDATSIALRNRALIALLYRAGLRAGEALAIRTKDIDWEAGAVRVLHAKGGRARTVGIDPAGLAMVRAWAERRASLGLDGRAPLLCSLSGSPLTDGYVRRLLPRLGMRGGIEKRVHAHGLRHAHAAELRSEGIDIGVISKQLGHRSIATTALYLDHIAPVDVVRAVGKREWRAMPTARAASCSESGLQRARCGGVKDFSPSVNSRGTVDAHRVAHQCGWPRGAVRGGQSGAPDGLRQFRPRRCGAWQ